jgi:hypothetical protein
VISQTVLAFKTKVEKGVVFDREFVISDKAKTISCTCIRARRFPKENNKNAPIIIRVFFLEDLNLSDPIVAPRTARHTAE